MTTIEGLIDQVTDLRLQDVEAWIDKDWVRADGHPGHYAFRRIDVARIRLIQQLRIEMQVNDEALPIVLSLLDQLYEHRRRLRDLCNAFALTATDDVRQAMTRHLMDQPLFADDPMA
jgi:chaperone modulatory protein CbpM